MRPNSLVTVFLVLGLTTFLLGCSHDTESPTRAGGVVHNTGPGAWMANDGDVVMFELQQVFGSDEGPLEHTLAEPVAAAADPSGNVYILDMQDSRLVSFSKDGSFRWSSGQAGQGPGEFENAFTLAVGPDELYVSNIAGTRIDRFSFDGEYIDSNSPAEYGAGDRASLLGFATPTQPVLVGMLPGKSGATVTVFDSAADSVFSQLVIDMSEDVQLPPGFAITPDLAISHGLLTSGHISKFRQSYFNPRGENIRTVTRDLDKLVPPGTLKLERGATMRVFSMVGAPYWIGPNRWLSVSHWPTNVSDPAEYMRMKREDQPKPINIYCVDVFDESGQLLWSREYPDETPIGRIDSVTDDGILYTIADAPFPQVRRYRVVVEEGVETDSASSNKATY